MPNWVKNKLIFKKDDVLISITNKYFKRGDIDFNSILPMPVTLDIEYSSMSSDALKYFLIIEADKLNINEKTLRGISKQLYLDQNIIDPNANVKTCDPLVQLLDGTHGDLACNLVQKYLKKFDSYHDIELIKLRCTKGEIIDKKQIIKDELYSLGLTQIKNYVNYGAVNWYFWCIKNWGTKWTAANTQAYYASTHNLINCNFEVINKDFGNHCFISFETAWDPAIPVLLELSKQNPETKFALIYADEVEGCNCGYMLFNNGHIDYKGKFPDYSEDAIKLHHNVWRQ